MASRYPVCKSTKENKTVRIDQCSTVSPRNDKSCNDESPRKCGEKTVAALKPEGGIWNQRCRRASDGGDDRKH